MSNYLNISNLCLFFIVYYEFFGLIVINILVKTAFTVFVVPYTALGFEMCTNYDDRTSLQGVRFGFNMIVNFVFGALGWVLFFKDGVAEDGSRIDGTKIMSNFHNMGIVLTIATILLVLFCVFTTYKYADKHAVEELAKEGEKSFIKAFIHDLKDIFSDKLMWFVMVFFAIAHFSMVIVAQVQMFTYVDYMQFTQAEKSFVHGGGMIGFMIGSLILGKAVKRFDKKKTGYRAMLVSSAGGLLLLAVFTGGLLDPQAEIGGFSIAVVAFGIFQMMWWGGCGVLVPLATAMIGDLSEVKKWQMGEVTEGRYAAGFSFFSKATLALGLFCTGVILQSVGYVSGQETQSSETIDNVALITFITGPILMAVSFLVY